MLDPKESGLEMLDPDSMNPDPLICYIPSDLVHKILTLEN
jgi:hypothetical protein